MRSREKRKIVFVVPVITHYRKKFYSKLSKNHNYKIKVLSGKKVEEDGRPEYKGKVDFENYKVPVKKKYGLTSYQGLLGLLFKERPDIIVIPDHVGTLSFWLVIILKKIKKWNVIVWACAWEGPHIFGFKKVIRKFLRKIFFRFSDHVIAYSTKAKYECLCLGVKDSKISIAFNGLAVDKNPGKVNRKNESTVKENKKLRKNIVFLYVGGLIPEKKPTLLIKAYGELERVVHKAFSGLDVTLWIVGDGPLRSQVLNEIENSKIKNYKYFGRVIDGVDEIFKQCNFLVMPGAGGLAINQAMYWGKPCIVSRCDGTEEDLVLEGVTGFRFNEDNYYDLSKKMFEALLLDPDEYKIMGNFGRQLILKRSNVDKMVETFEVVFREI